MNPHVKKNILKDLEEKERHRDECEIELDKTKKIAKHFQRIGRTLSGVVTLIWLVTAIATSSLLTFLVVGFVALVVYGVTMTLQMAINTAVTDEEGALELARAEVSRAVAKKYESGIV